MSDKVYYFAVGITGVVATAVNLVFKFMDVSWLTQALAISGLTETFIVEVLSVFHKNTPPVEKK